MLTDRHWKTRPVFRQRGLTLIELIVFIVIILVGVAGILSVMNITTRASADPMVRKQSMAFAEAVLEEKRRVVIDRNARFVAEPGQQEIRRCTRRGSGDGNGYPARQCCR